MNFLKPIYLYLLILIPLLLLLYILRLRRNTYIVSSCLLWEQAIEDMKANTPFQRFRKNILLPLQIIFLTLVIFALARPFWRTDFTLGQNVILIIDCSASMKAVDVEGSRLEGAKSAALKMVDGLDESSRMMLIEARSSPELVLGFSSDKKQIRDAIKNIRPSDTTTNLIDAIRLASSMAKDIKKSEIILMSDGASKLPEQPGQIDVPLRFIGFGRKDFSNAGITALEIANSSSDDRKSQLFIALQNFDEKEKQKISLEIYLDDELMDVRELNLMPEERRSVIFDNAEYKQGIIKAMMDINDDLSVDNYAYCILKKPESLSLLMVSKDNIFIQEAINSVTLQPATTDIKLLKEEPVSYSADSRYDISIFDSFVPDRLPEGNIIFINPEMGLPFGKILQRAGDPHIIDWNKEHPVMRFVDISNLQINSAVIYDMPLWMKPLVDSDAGTLAWAGENDSKRIIVLPFQIKPPSSSNFPLLAAFPIFVSNALRWLAGAEEGAGHGWIKPGQPFKISIPDSLMGQTVVVKNPAGERANRQIEDKYFVYEDTELTGIYEISGQGLSEKFAVSLLDEFESNIQPADKLDIAGKQITSSAISEVSNREIWASLIFVALILLGIEWWAYHRRVLV